MNIQFSKQNINKSDLNDVISILKSGWLTHGKYSEEFEKIFINYTKSKYATVLSSCTAGLHLACLALGVGKGDEVIVPTITHTATAHSVEYTGAKPIFVQCDMLTGNMDLNDLKRKINKKTKVIIPVHMSGIMVDIFKIKDICKGSDIKIIEDCAHALGSKLKDKHAGTIGDLGVFSFYPTKQITTGEGGMVITNNKSLIDKISKLKAFGIDTPINKRKKPGLYDVKSLGYNYRMTDFQAVLGLNQIKRYEKNLLSRKQIAKTYFKFLNNKKITMPEFSNDNSYYIFQINFKSGNLREKAIKKLKENGIGFGIMYAKPVPLLKYYKKKYGYRINNFKISKLYSDRCLSLPCYPSLKKVEVKHICKILNKV